MVEAFPKVRSSPPVGFSEGWQAIPFAPLALASVMNGMPLMVVARNLGHADTRMVEMHYGHLKQDYVTEEIRKGAPKFGFKPNTRVVSMK